MSEQRPLTSLLEVRRHRQKIQETLLLTAFEGLLHIIKTNAQNIGRTLAMARFDLQKRYSGSTLGIFWSLVRPMLFIGVYWFAITVGIRGGKPINGAPFILWLTPGIVPWFFMSDALTIGGQSIRDNKHLVTKMVYPIPTIPVFTVLSLFTVHLMLLAITIAIFLLSGWGLDMYAVQLAYYVAAGLIFALVVATLLSALTTVSRDIGHLVKSIVQVLFWLTPILYPLAGIGNRTLRTLVMLNPICYLVEGYRNAFVYKTWFFQQWLYMSYFWALTFALALLASYLYSKLSKDFADVL